MGVQRVHVVWMLVLSGHVCGALELLQRSPGEEVVLPCSVPPSEPGTPFAFRLERCWRRQEVLTYMHTGAEPFSRDPQYGARIRVSGGPSDRRLNVSLSGLRASDTDRYCCRFILEDRPDDRTVPGEEEFFLYVPHDDPLAVVHIEACAGGSAVLPCASPLAQQGAVQGFSVVRQRSSGPVEVLYRSRHPDQHRQQHHLSSTTARLPPSSPLLALASPLPADRLRLTTAVGPGGVAYNVTLLRLQPAESGHYACNLLSAGRPGAGLGPRVYHVSVQGGQCGCSTYTTLLYALFAAVAVLLLLLLLLLLVFWARRRTPVKPQAQVPVYEEMVGVRQPKPKLGSCGHGTLNLEEMEVSEYSNSLVPKPRAENHYESPSLARIIQG